MTLIAILFGGWVLIALVAWALCRIAHTSDEAINAMRTDGGWRNRGES